MLYVEGQKSLKAPKEEDSYSSQRFTVNLGWWKGLSDPHPGHIQSALIKALTQVAFPEPGRTSLPSSPHCPALEGLPAVIFKAETMQSFREQLA